MFRWEFPPEWPSITVWLMRIIAWHIVRGIAACSHSTLVVPTTHRQTDRQTDRHINRYTPRSFFFFSYACYEP